MPVIGSHSDACIDRQIFVSCSSLYPSSSVSIVPVLEALQWRGEYAQSALKYPSYLNLSVPVLVQYQCWKGRDAQSYCCYCQYQCSTSAGGLQWRGEYAQSALPAGGWLWPCLTICLQMSRCFSSCSS